MDLRNQLASGVPGEAVACVQVRLVPVLGVQHRVQRGLDIDQKPADLGEVLALVGLAVEDVQDHGGEEVRGALVPEVQIARFAPQGVDEDADDILDVGDLHDAFADLEQRVPAHRVGIGRREIEDVAEALPMVGGDVPELALAVIDEGAVRPGNQGRDHMAGPLPAPRGPDDYGVLDAAISQVAAGEPAQNPAHDLPLWID